MPRLQSTATLVSDQFYFPCRHVKLVAPWNQARSTLIVTHKGVPSKNCASIVNKTRLQPAQAVQQTHASACSCLCSQVKLVAPGAMPRLGKGGTLQSRQALLHSLVHIESWAIDLSWDIIARFGSDARYNLPNEFFDDFVQVIHVLFQRGTKLLLSNMVCH